ncbi:hypothetical protein AUP68_03274 [Ilyonectria robusta]
MFFPSHFSHFLPLTLCIKTRQSLSRHSLRSRAGDRVRCYIYLSTRPCSLFPLSGPALFDPTKPYSIECIPCRSTVCYIHPRYETWTNCPQLYRQPVGRGFWQERDEGSLLCTASRGEIPKKSGRIAWITPSNALVQDAGNRLLGAISVDMIRRVMPWEAEPRALTTVPRELTSFDPEIGRASGSEKQLIAHVNTFNTSQHKFHTASLILIPSTLNNLAKDLAEGDRTKWSD